MEKSKLDSNTYGKCSARDALTVEFVRLSFSSDVIIFVDDDDRGSIVETNMIPRNLVDGYDTSTSMQQPPTDSHTRILLVDGTPFTHTITRGRLRLADMASLR